MSILRSSALLPVWLFFMSSLSIAADTSSGTPSTIVAKQGGAIVTLEDIDAFAQRIPEGQRAGFFDSPSRIEALITNLLTQKQMAAEARGSGLDKDPLVQKQIEIADEEVLSKVRMQHFRTDMKLPDFDQLAQERYTANKSQYIEPSKLIVQHILIDTKSRSEEEAKALADVVEKEAKAHPDQFDALVEKYSDDPSKSSNHGKIENAGDDKKYMAAFVAASKALKKVGDISPPAQTSYGFHIIKLIERIPEHQRTFAQAKADIVKQVREDYIQKQVQTYTDTMKNLPLDANADLVASLRTRYGDMEAMKAAADKAADDAAKADASNADAKKN
ncbi:MAG: peptidylprolyl isomerase [Rhodanobacter sp.]|jgi:peptidyl-prolyl cis-trans isomerase C|nr:peptidylprolyl isomerase [Rhodanobacter sp.]